jgi:hypothetical protein
MRNVVVCHLSVDYLEARPGMRSSRWPLVLLGRNWFKCYRYFMTDILVWQRPAHFSQSASPALAGALTRSAPCLICAVG